MTANVSQSFHGQAGGLSPGGWALGLGVAAGLLLAGALPESWQALLGYRRVAVIEGLQGWRLLTAQSLHLGRPHLLLNLAGWALLCMLLMPAVSTRTLSIVLAGSVTGTAAGLLLTPEVAWYVGFSGALHGVLGGGAVVLLRSRRGLAMGLLLGLASKLAWDVVSGGEGGGLPAGARVVVEAHLWGSAGGLLAGVLHQLFTRRPRCV